MLKHNPLLEAFNKSQLQRNPPDYFQNLKIFEALFEEAKRLGIFPLKNPLEGLEKDIHLARALNVRSTT